jgi:hypothetical protein
MRIGGVIKEQVMGWVDQINSNACGVGPSVSPVGARRRVVG